MLVYNSSIIHLITLNVKNFDGSMETKCALICEYNPFHNGHLYQLDEIYRLTNSRPVCIMSGQFVQRAEPAIIDKYKRAQIAVANGAAAVVELPVAYSTACAEVFACGAVKIIKKLKNINTLAMGCETDNPKLLTEAADIAAEESPDFCANLKELLSTGISYPRAYTQAVCSAISGDGCRRSLLFDMLNLPNNLLCFEYLKAIKREGLNIKPLFIKRIGDYNDESIQGAFASAGAIRKHIKNGSFLKIERFIPKKSLDILKNGIETNLPNMEIFNALILEKLRRCSLEYLAALPDCREGMQYAVKRNVDKCTNIEQLSHRLKSKRYTLSSIRRMFLQALLGITKEISYADIIVRVLAVNSEYKQNIAHLLYDNKMIGQLYNSTPEAQACMDTDIAADHVYKVITGACGNYFTNKIYTVEE